MLLTDITPVEQLAHGTIYRAISKQVLHPGQHVVYYDMVEVLRCDSNGANYQLLIHSLDKLPSTAEVQLVGNPINWIPDQPVHIFCEGVGNFTAIHWINSIRRDRQRPINDVLHCLVMWEAEQFKFRPVPSRFMTPEYPADMIAAMPLLDDLGIISRLACNRFQPGCFEGSMTELLIQMSDRPEHWAAMATESTITAITEILGDPIFSVTVEELSS